MKVLHIVPSYKPAYIYGGTIECVARLCEGLVNAGVQIKVFTTTANGETELNVEPNIEHDVDGVSVIYFKRIFKDPFYISPALWKRLSKECKDYDLVHIHSWWNILVLIAAFICRRKKVKIIISPHGMMSEYILQNSNRFLKRLMHIVAGRSLLKASLFHATSGAEFSECTQLVPEWKGFVIPNIVWLPQLHISKKRNPAFTIIFLSRIHPKKGIELLLEAISLMEIKPFLQIAGTGKDDYIRKLKEKINVLGIEKNVEWMGWQNREEKFTALMQADLLSLTSYNENFAIVVVEALYTGTPVLISENIGLSGFISKYKLGWICKTDVKDIALKLSEAIKDQETRNRISKCAPVLVQNNLSEKQLIPLYLMNYQS